MFGPIAALEAFILNTFNITGRASRAEYWWVQLWFTLALVVAVFIDFMSLAAQGQVTLSVFAYFTPWLCLLSLVPQITLCARRLHDSGRTALWYFISFVPFVGPLVLLVLLCATSQPGANRWGAPQSPRSANSRGTDKKAQAKAAPKHDPMQGYKVLLTAQVEPSPETNAERKAKVQEYYRTHVLKQAQA